MLLLCIDVPMHAQIGPSRVPSPVSQSSAHTTDDASESKADQQAEAELQKGTALTARGAFAEAIPHLLAARGHVSDDYAASFNLALCYVATSQFRRAIAILSDLRVGGRTAARVESLLAQAYVGDSQPEKALDALNKTVSLDPNDEKLFVFVADACMQERNYLLGVKVTDLGLQHLPQSARLHYQRAIFQNELEDDKGAAAEFAWVRENAAGTEIAYVSTGQQYLLEGKIAEAIDAARQGLKRGYENPMLLTILGEALIRAGVSVGEPEFVEAQTALKQAVAQRPNEPDEIGRAHV